MLGPLSPLTGGEGRAQLLLRACVLPPLRRFSSNAVLTPEEQEQRAIYAAILEYEQDHVSKQAPACFFICKVLKKETGRG